MYDVKIIDRDNIPVALHQSTWLVKETVRMPMLRILERAVIIAPEGKFVTLIVNGVGHELEPGAYYGDVVLAVTDAYHMAPHGLMRIKQNGRLLHSAVVVENNQVTHLLPEIIQGSEVTGTALTGGYIASSEECFNGVVIAGDSEYTVKGLKADFEGFSDNDFMGVGSVVTAVDTARVTIEDCDFTLSGVTRCAVHAGGDSFIHVKNTSIENISPWSDWLGFFSWQIALLGTNRLVQLADNANVLYENCRLKTNGWGVCSIDGTEESVKLHIKDSSLELSGPRSHGYGAFCIGENEVVLENCDVNVYGYPLMLMGMEGLGKATIDGTRIRGRRFGVFVIADDDSVLNIRNSDIRTRKSSLCVKGSSTIINVDNTVLEPENGVLLQLMDTDECGMNVEEFYVPVGEVDKALPGRDLTVVSPTEDVTLNIRNCELAGDLFNSTSEIRAYKTAKHGSLGAFHDTVIGVIMPPPDAADNGGAGGGPDMNPVLARHNGDDLRGAKNLGVNLENTTLKGVISAAVQAYMPGVRVINDKNRLELSNVTQTASAPVNNGVVVSLDKSSVWEVTGTSYLTKLELAEGAVIKAADGKTLKMTVDGAEKACLPGVYTGKIVLELA